MPESTGAPPSSPCPLCLSFGREQETATAATTTTTVPAASVPVAPTAGAVTAAPAASAPIAAATSSVIPAPVASPAATGATSAASAPPGVTSAVAGSSSDAAVQGPPKKKQKRRSSVVHRFKDFNKFTIKRHYSTCHPLQWAAFQKAQREHGRSKETNASFFSPEKITAHFARRTPGPSSVVISTAIGNLSKELYAKETDKFARTESGIVLCHGDDCTPVEDEEDVDDMSNLHYLAVMPSLATFLHVIFLVSRGLSFLQVSDLIRHERDLWQEVRRCIEPVSPRQATFFTRLIAVPGLQALGSVLKKCWTFSVAADGSKQFFGVAYFSIMIRIPPFKLGDDIQTLHVVAPPLRGSHTGEAMFSMTKKTLDAIDAGWCPKLMASTSDGAANMLGCEVGWQTRLEEASQESGEETFFKFHCGPHRLNLVNGKAMKALQNTLSEWTSELHKTVKFTRKEANLIEETGSQSPYHIEVRWSSLEIVLAWYRKHIDRLEAHYVAKEKEIAENTPWWCTLILLHEHFAIVGIAMKSLQYRTLLMESQSQIFVELRDKLVEFHGLSESAASAAAPSAADGLTEEGLATVVESGSGDDLKGSLGRWEVVYASIWESLPDFGLDARNLYDTVEDEEEDERDDMSRQVSRDVAAVALTTVHYLDAIIEEEDKREMPPPTKPLGIAEMPVTDFQDIVNGVKRRIVAGLGSNAPREACDEHSELRKLVRRNGELKASFEVADTKTSTFAECWAPAGTQFPMLRTVAAGFATIFPGSSPVESDFSILRQDKSPQRSRMADLSVEGKFHARQWEVVEVLAAVADGMATAN